MMCAPLFVFSYLIVCFMMFLCHTYGERMLNETLPIVIFLFVFMDVIQIKLKCIYIISSVTGGGIISRCDVFVYYCDSVRCLL